MPRALIVPKKVEDAVAPRVASRDDRGPTRHEAALGLVVQHYDELGTKVGLAAQRLVRDDDRGSRQSSRRDAIEHILRDGDAVERVLGVVRVVDLTAVQRRPASLRAKRTCCRSRHMSVVGGRTDLARIGPEV